MKKPSSPLSPIAMPPMPLHFTTEARQVHVDGQEDDNSPAYLELHRSKVLFERYTLEAELGLWSFGTLQVLKSRSTEKIMTCKTAVKQALNYAAPSLCAKLRGLSKVRHPHLCPVNEVLEDTKHVYIITERPSGGDLQSLMDNAGSDHWLQEACIAAYVCQVLTAMAFCHAEGVHHRNMHLGSVLLTSKLPDATAVVSDFGLAPLLDTTNSALLQNSSPYQAPELQMKMGQVSGVGLDVWSLGTITHTLLVGKPPMENTGAWDISPSRFMAKRHDEELWRSRSALSRDFVRSALEVCPTDRPTAALLLNHPWLRTVMIPRGVSGEAHTSMKATLQYCISCYVMSILLLPAFVGKREFFQLFLDFSQLDTRHEQSISRRSALSLLTGRRLVPNSHPPTTRELEASLDVLDIRNIGVFSLSSVASAGLLAALAASAYDSGPLVSDAWKKSVLQDNAADYGQVIRTVSGKSDSPKSLRGRSSSPTGIQLESPSQASSQALFGRVQQRSGSPPAQEQQCAGKMRRASSPQPGQEGSPVREQQCVGKMRRAGSPQPGQDASPAREQSSFSPPPSRSPSRAQSGSPRSMSRPASPMSPVRDCKDSSRGSSPVPREQVPVDPRRQHLADFERELRRRFFETYGQKGQPAVRCSDLHAWMATPTGRFLEQYAGVNFTDIFAPFPEDCLFDDDALRRLATMECKGTPHYFGNAAAALIPKASAGSFEESLSSFLKGLLLTCGPCDGQHED